MGSLWVEYTIPQVVLQYGWNIGAVVFDIFLSAQNVYLLVQYITFFLVV